VQLRLITAILAEPSMKLLSRAIVDRAAAARRRGRRHHRVSTQSRRARRRCLLHRSPTTVGIASADTKPQSPAVNSADYAEKQCKARRQKLADSGKVYVVAKGDNSGHDREEVQGRVRRFALALNHNR